VAGEPLIRRILKWLRACGVTDAVLNLHHLPQTITRRVGDGSDLDLHVRYSWEVPLLGSAGGPRLAAPLIGSDSFLVVNGDTLTDAPIEPLVEAHRRSGAQVTMAVVAHREAAKYGGIVTGDDDAAVRFAGRGASDEARHFIGVQVVDAEAFARVPAGAAAESVSEVYPALIAARPGSVRVHQCDAEFFDIGTPADYLQTSLLIGQREGGRDSVGSGVHVDPTATIVQSILWDDIVVGAATELKRCIVADGTRVPAGTNWSDVTLRPANGRLAAGETVIEGMAVGPLRAARVKSG
jgi:NDP-sugar pyrophosphorylase family protein